MSNSMRSAGNTRTSTGAPRGSDTKKETAVDLAQVFMANHYRLADIASVRHPELEGEALVEKTMQYAKHRLRYYDEHFYERLPSGFLASRFPASSLAIQRTLHPDTRLVQHVGINHRRAHILVPQEFLHGPNVIPGLQQVRRKRVTQRVTTHSLVHERQTGRHFHCALQNCRIHMMPAPLLMLTRQVRRACRKHPLPSPTPSGRRPHLQSQCTG